MSSTVQRLRIAHIITQLELGGAQQNTLYTIAHLNTETYEPILICGSGGILDDEAKAGSWPTYFVPTLVRPVRPWQDVIAGIKIYKLLRKIKPHVVHTHSSKAGIIGRIAAYFAGVPVIIHTFHGFGFTPGQPEWMQRLFIQAERLCAHLSTHLVFVSEDNQEEALALGITGEKPTSLIRSGILIQETPRSPAIREELGIASTAWIVLSVGNFKPQKNPMDLVKTAKAILTQDSTIHFVFVGDGELRSSVEEAAQKEGIAQNLHFMGWRKDIPQILAASDSFLLTSLWEGLPRAIVEASVARVPSVAYAVNGVKDILKEGETGFPIPPHQFELAAEKLLWLKNHPEEARRIGQKARARVETEFNIDNMVRQQENLYKSLYDAVPLKLYYEPLWNNPL